DRSQSLRSNGEADETCRCRGCRPRGRAGRSFLRVPRIAGRAAEPDVAVGERAGTGFAQKHRAGRSQLVHDGRIARRHTIFVGLRSPGSAYLRDIEQVLDAVRNTMEAGADAAFGEIGIGGRSL